MKKIIFVSHCILNTSSKVVMYNTLEMEKEENARKSFLKYCIDNDIQIIQLPCPEFTLYGSKRWGHVSNQFDNPFFRKHCRKILMPIIDQLKEYLNNNESFEVLGIMGINGSPSCGVEFTCSGDWFGSFEERKDLDKTLSTASIKYDKGIFMDELNKLLNENNLNNVKLLSLNIESE